jgi:hypothetical protein
VWWGSWGDYLCHQWRFGCQECGGRMILEYVTSFLSYTELRSFKHLVLAFLGNPQGSSSVNTNPAR